MIGSGTPQEIRHAEKQGGGKHGWNTSGNQDTVGVEDLGFLEKCQFIGSFVTIQDTGYIKQFFGNS